MRDGILFVLQSAMPSLLLNCKFPYHPPKIITICLNMLKLALKYSRHTSKYENINNSIQVLDHASC